MFGARMEGGCWTIWKERNKIAFDNEVLLIPKLKRNFVCFLWSEAKLCIKDDPLTLVGFIDWLRAEELLVTGLLVHAMVRPMGWSHISSFVRPSLPSHNSMPLCRMISPCLEFIKRAVPASD